MTTHPEDSPEVAAAREAFERQYPSGDKALDKFGPGNPFFHPDIYVSANMQSRWRAFQAGAAWQRKKVEARCREAEAELAKLFAKDGPLLMGVQQHLDPEDDWDELEDACRAADARLEKAEARCRKVEAVWISIRSALDAARSIHLDPNKEPWDRACWLAFLDGLISRDPALLSPAPEEGGEGRC